uniref:Uncharacterized protein n=1 Tax=Xenopus tropicalis TaxID=8364 RepID=A0A6I8RA51_XENTR
YHLEQQFSTCGSGTTDLERRSWAATPGSPTPPQGSPPTCPPTWSNSNRSATILAGGDWVWVKRLGGPALNSTDMWGFISLYTDV